LTPSWSHSKADGTRSRFSAQETGTRTSTRNLCQTCIFDTLETSSRKMTSCTIRLMAHKQLTTGTSFW